MAEGAGSYILDARSDVPDSRDRIYRPSLIAQQAKIDPRQDPTWWNPGRVRDQGADPSCTGHALAAAVDHLLTIARLRSDQPEALEPKLSELSKPYASAFMLYGNAQLHDEWDGEGYSGSSLRGALKGFHHNGLCSIDIANEVRAESSESGDPDRLEEGWRWYTNRLISEDARKVLLGGYYRVLPVLAEMHCALQESNVLVAASAVHAGWQTPDADGLIPFDENQPASVIGCHAFAIIGYCAEGWIIQNSWGRGWGQDGVAVWTYADWAQHISDVWALRLAAPIPKTFRYSVGAQGSASFGSLGETRSRLNPTRLDILGHLLPIVDGRLVRYGRFHHDRRTLKETVRIILCRHSAAKEAKSGRGLAGKNAIKRMAAADFKYRHLMFHVLGGTRSEIEAARMVRALHPIYRANGVYPIFLLWESALGAELRTRTAQVIEAGRFESALRDSSRGNVSARLLEIEATGIPARIRRELERSVRRFFYNFADVSMQSVRPTPANGATLLAWLFEELSWRHRAGSMSYHIVTHDLSVRFASELLANYPAVERPNYPVISTLHLVAPLIDRQRFVSQIVPKLASRGDGRINRRAQLDAPAVEQAFLWHQTRAQADVDRFHPDYPHAWPEFWARVMGMVGDRDGADQADFDRVADPGGNKTFPIVRSLAIERYAQDLAQEAGRAQWALETRAFEDEPELGRVGHFEIDGTPQVVNGILESILGPEGVKRQLTLSDWQASR